MLEHFQIFLHVERLTLNAILEIQGNNQME